MERNAELYVLALKTEALAHRGPVRSLYTSHSEGSDEREDGRQGANAAQRAWSGDRIDARLLDRLGEGGEVAPDLGQDRP